MIAIKIGTTEWRAAIALVGGEVEFVGTFLYAADGITPLMVWDGGLGNVRAMTAPEIAALPGQRATAAAQQAKTAATASIDNGQLQSGVSIERLVRALALITLDEINILRAAVLHPIVSITRVTTVATVTTLDPHGLNSGDTARIVGTTLAAYNVSAVATVTSTTVFTYPVAGSPVTPAVGSMFFAMGAIPATQPRTPAQIVTAIKAKIALTAE
jgi:hypothetical protein